MKTDPRSVLGPLRGRNWKQDDDEYDDDDEEEVAMSLLADDTTVIGMSDKMEAGKQIIEKVMGKFEERANESKEEKMEFGERDSEEIRMLGTYMGNEHDNKMQIKRAARAWMQIKRDL